MCSYELLIGHRVRWALTFSRTSLGSHGEKAHRLDMLSCAMQLVSSADWSPFARLMHIEVDRSHFSLPDTVAATPTWALGSRQIGSESRLKSDKDSWEHKRSSWQRLRHRLDQKSS